MVIIQKHSYIYDIMFNLSAKRFVLINNRPMQGGIGRRGRYGS